MNDELCWTPATQLAQLVRNRKVSPSDVAEACIARIERVNPAINAFVFHDPEQIRRDARALTDAVADGSVLGPLHGVPYTIKDSCPVAGLPFTSGLAPTKNRIAESDAVIVERLRAAGGLFLGKTNLAEAGYCASSRNTLFGPVHNAWRHGVTAGGSSSGAAAAVASGLGQLAQGSDGGGSVRIPAALNGIVGFKPSLGRIPLNILSGRYYTFACNGTLTRTVADAALMLDVAAGLHSSDPLSLPTGSTRYLAGVSKEIGPLRIAWSADLGFATVDEEIVEICEQAVRDFEQLGCQVVNAHPGWPDPEKSMWNGIWAPTYAALGDAFEWEQWRGQVEDQLIDVIHEGAGLSALDIARADATRGRMWDLFSRFMTEHDLLVSPVVASQPFPATQFCPDSLAGQSLRRQLLGWLLTYPFNMLGVPAISVPAGFTRAGLPVGLQIIGRMHADALVLQAAAAYERIRPWSALRPPEVTGNASGAGSGGARRRS